MILYLDTSSLVKLYVEEEGSDEVRGRVSRASLVATSVVAYAETRAALARLRRQGDLTRAEQALARASFERDWSTFARVEVTEPIYRRAGDLAEEHGLRGFDGLHLASYLDLARGAEGVPVTFSAFDGPLVRAARKTAQGGRTGAGR